MVRKRYSVTAPSGTAPKRSQVLKFGALVYIWSFYPVIFALSHNWFVITAEQIWFLLYIVPLAGIIIYGLWCAILIFIKRLWVRHRSPTSSGGDPIAASAACAIVVMIYIFLHSTLLSVFKTELWILFILGAFGSVIYILLVVKRVLPVFFMGAGLIIFAGAEWAYIYFVEEGYIRKTSAFAMDTGWDVNGKGLNFSDMPNIYLIVYDGYGNKESLKIIYDLDNSGSYEFLRSKGFIVNEYAFSNYRSTWPTMLGLFLANHHYYGITTGWDDTSVGRLVLNSTTLNPTFFVLKSNGYKMQTINRGSYFGDERREIDYFFPQSIVANGFEIFDSSYLKFLLFKPGEEADSPQWEKLDERIAFAANDSSPWFTFAYIQKPGHALSKSVWTELDGFEDFHRRQLEDANRHMRDIVERIQSKDPNAFIILMGDHGGWRYIRSWQAENPGNPNEAFEVNAVTARTVTLDYFGILMAIETGGRCDEYIYDTLTPVNLMRVIFSCLSGEDLLANKPRDDSYFRDSFEGRYSNFLTVESGVVLDRWEPLTERMKTHGTETLP